MARASLRIGELSRQAGCNIETIRYYERVALLPKPSRTGSYRRYESADVERLRFIRRARALGFSLDEIRALLRLADAPGNSCGQVRDLAAAHLADVHAKIADLRRMERALRKAVNECDEGTASRCPIIETLSH